MKVLWFTNTPANATEYLKDGPVGGGWLKALDRVLKKDVDLHVAFYYPKMEQPFRFESTSYYPIKRKNWKFFALVSILWERLIDNQDLEKYLNIIDMVKPDIIHIHGTENSFSCIIPHIKIPVVISIQGCITVYYHKFDNGFTILDQLSSCLNFSKSFRQFLWNKSFFRIKNDFRKMRSREQKNLSYTEYIIGRTDWDRRISSVLAPMSHYYHSDELLRDAFYYFSWEPAKKSKVIIHSTTGNSTYKGFETLCEALFILSSIKEIQFEWQIVGVYPTDNIVKVTKNKLKGQFPISGLNFLGEINEDKLLEKLCNADIYVSPSHIENSSNSLCEALLIGMPTIASFAGGTGSLITDKEDGILVQDGDPWALAGAILELVRNPNTARSYGRKAREKALKRHNHETIVRELKLVYEQIIGDYYNQAL
jgi:glycosyltransferase involved in cell wall biosynthesis